jgi:hypothetical protein
MHSLLTYDEVTHVCLVSWAILYNVWLKADLLAGQVLHRRDFNVAHPVCDKGAIGIDPQMRDNMLHNENTFTGPFFMKRRSPLIQSSRTLIIIFLTFIPELTLRSGIMA